MSKKTEFEIIKETILFYNQNPQSVGADKNGNCYFSNSDGSKRCAIGRLMSLEGALKAQENNFGMTQLAFSGSTSETLRQYGVPDDYLIDDPRFWEKLQRLHDCYYGQRNWTLKDWLEDLFEGRLSETEIEELASL